MKRLREIVFTVALFFVACGCVPRIADVMGRSVNAAVPVLVAAEEAEGNAAIDAAPKEEAAIDDAIAAVEERWEPVWFSLRTFTAAHNRYADALEQGREGDLSDVVFAYCALRPVVVEWVALPDVGCPGG